MVASLALLGFLAIEIGKEDWAWLPGAKNKALVSATEDGCG